MVGKRIRSFRKLKNLTQKELAILSGVSEISIRKYEAEDRTPGSDQLKKIAQALDIDANRLLGIKLDKIEVQTIGDAMSILFLLHHNIGITLIDGINEDGSIDPESLTIKFNNIRFNEALAEWLLKSKNLDDDSPELQNICNELKDNNDLL